MKNTTDISRFLKSIAAATSVLAMIIALVACAEGNKKQTFDDISNIEFLPIPEDQNERIIEINTLLSVKAIPKPALRFV